MKDLLVYRIVELGQGGIGADLVQKVLGLDNFIKKILT